MSVFCYNCIIKKLFINYYIMKKNIKDLSQSGVFTKIVLPIILVIILGLIAWLTFRSPGLSMDEVKEKTEAFINKELMLPGTKANISKIEDIYGLYKLEVDIGSDIVESYVTKDAKVFFPQAFMTEEMSQEGEVNGDQNNPPVNVNIPKSEKPQVELFVMSHCPYGTQIEKGILPVVAALGDKIDFELKFVDYAMHGEKELVEQINQYCIMEEEEDKFMPYLECFLEAGNSESCLASNNIDTKKLATCVKETDSEFKIMENFQNQANFKGSYPSFNIYAEDNLKYSVGGSPTLVINETEVQSGRSPQALLNTICAGFEEAPDECSVALSGDTPAPGFGSGVTSASAAAECN